jgi:hypothetical protein
MRGQARRLPPAHSDHDGVGHRNERLLRTTFVATPRTAISTPDSSESLPSQAAVAMHTPGESRL